MKAKHGLLAAIITIAVGLLTAAWQPPQAPPPDCNPFNPPKNQKRCEKAGGFWSVTGIYDPDTGEIVGYETECICTIG